MTIRRSAIYTRKSTEEGLDQEFNSLDAQREACAAYILSQRHEGWRESPKRYDGGGFSGGSMERPALTRLLEDDRWRPVHAGRALCTPSQPALCRRDWRLPLPPLNGEFGRR